MPEREGLTQAELWERTGCAKNTVARLERGEQEPAWPPVLAFGKALGVSCEAFTGSSAVAPRPGLGRPAKAKPAASDGEPKRPRGRPRKEQRGGST